jgi:hypothetical protein
VSQTTPLHRANKEKEASMHKTSKFLTSLATCLGGAFLFGCGGLDPSAGDTESTLGEASEALMMPGIANPWPNGIVPVCWQASAADHKNFVWVSNRILEIANDHYARAGNIQFEDAGRCPANPTGVIKVSHTSGVSNVTRLGYQGSGLDYNLFLNFDYPYFKGTSTADRQDTQQVIMHELAHTLGFDHEFRRADWANACDPDATNEPQPYKTFGTGADFNSITASTYCQENTVLSPSDVTGIRSAYGAPGSQRYNIFASDSGNDVWAQYWTGSTWAWSELVPNLYETTSRVGVDTIRVGNTNQVRAFSLAGPNFVQNYWNGSSWTSNMWTDKSVDLEPRVVAYRDFGTGPSSSFVDSKAKWFAFTRDTSGNLVAIHNNGSTSAWQVYNKPAGGSISSVDAVTFRDYGEVGTRIYAFATAADGNIYANSGVGSISSGSWSASLGKPSIGSAGPLTVTSFRDCFNAAGCAANTTRKIHVWTVSGGTLWLLEWNGSAWAWSNQGAPALVSLTGRPAAVQWTEEGSRRHSIYVRDTTSRLMEYFWNGSAWTWLNHGNPTGGATSDPSVVTNRTPQLPAVPTGVTLTGNSRYAFVVNNDGRVFVNYTTDGVNFAWADQTTAFGNVPMTVAKGATAVAYWTP